MEVKPVIVAKEGLARLGKDIITLEDQSTNFFDTTSLTDFISMLVDRITDIVEEGAAAIFYSTHKVVLKYLDPYHGQGNIATCTMQPHAVMQIIAKVKDRALTVQELDDFLFTVRDYYDGTEAKELYDRIQKLSVKKITSMTREKDRAGNYSYSFERKDGEGSVQFPAGIAFKTPVFENMDSNMVTVKYDLFIDYAEGENGPKISFILKNPLLNEQLEAYCKELIEQHLSTVSSVKRYFGTMTTINQTDSWKYQANGL